MHGSPLALALALTAGALLPRAAPAQTVLPMSVENGWFIADVEVAGVPARFIIDTGAGSSVVSESAMERFGLTAGRSITVQGASGPQTVRMTTAPSLRWGAVDRAGASLVVLPDDILTPDNPAAGTPSKAYDGIIGVEFLASGSVLFDPPNRRVVLLPSGVDVPMEYADRLGEPLPARRPAGLLGLDVAVDGVSMPAILDTGSRRVILSEAGGSTAGVEMGPGVERSSRGIGNRQAESRPATYTVTIGETDFRVEQGYVSDLAVFETLGYPEEVLLIGVPLLRGCPFLVSYERREVRVCREPVDGSR